MWSQAPSRMFGGVALLMAVHRRPPRSLAERESKIAIDELIEAPPHVPDMFLVGVVVGLEAPLKGGVISDVTTLDCEHDLVGGPFGPDRRPHHQTGVFAVEDAWFRLVVEEEEPRTGASGMWMRQCPKDDVRRRWLCLASPGQGLHVERLGRTQPPRIRLGHSCPVPLTTSPHLVAGCRVQGRACSIAKRRVSALDAAVGGRTLQRQGDGAARDGRLLSAVVVLPPLVQQVAGDHEVHAD